MMRMELRGADLAVRRLDALRLEPKRERRLLRRMGNRVVRESKKRITGQRDLEGRRWTPRADRSNRRKMLLGLRRFIRVRLEGGAAVVHVSNRLVSRIAAEHQEGLTEVINQAVAEEQARKSGRAKRQSMSRRGLTDHGGPMASRRQARRLRELGFGKTQKWIMEHFSAALAGYIIRKEEGRQPKGSWTIKLPARPFLGASAEDREALRGMILAELGRAR